MEENLTREEELILALLKSSLTKTPYMDLGELDKISWNQFLILAEKHEIMSLLYEAMPPQAPKEIRDVIRLRARQTVQKYYRMYFHTKYFCNVLREEGLTVFVLKGIAASAAYPVPEYRKSGDLDIFVPREAEFARAEEILVKKGLFRDPVQTEHHCVLFHHPEGFDIELHRAFIEDVDDDEINELLKELTRRLPGEILEVMILGNRFPVLSPAYQAFSLLLHMLHHYLHAGFGVRLLYDWAVFWQQDVTEEDRNTYLALAERFGLKRFSEFVTAICTEELGMEKDRVHKGPLKNRRAYRFFLKDIFESGEFGLEDDSRMVVLRGTSVSDYFREFHHQMKLHYPRAGKIFLFWPVLWFVTLIRFLKNNHKVRNTTALEVFKSSRERSRHSGELELFKRETKKESGV